jgi:hypothetical protein
MVGGKRNILDDLLFVLRFCDQQVAACAKWRLIRGR